MVYIPPEQFSSASTTAFGIGVMAYILLLFGILAMLMLTSSALQSVT